MLRSNSSSLILFLLCSTLLNSIRANFSNNHFNNDFPSLSDISEFMGLSNHIYDIGSCYDEQFREDILCHWYQDNANGTQLAVLSSDIEEYIAVVFAGVDEAIDIATNMEYELMSYGEASNPYHNEIFVHEGYNNAVFNSGVFYQVLGIIDGLIHSNPSLRIITSGHSMGGAEAILTATELAHKYPAKDVLSITFGAPKIGDSAWVDFANGFENLGIWRIVNEDDAIARSPPASISDEYAHVGHTVQIRNGKTSTYYLHYGNEDMSYASVLPEWDELSFFGGISDHRMSSYLESLTLVKECPGSNYVTEFEEDKGIMSRFSQWISSVSNGSSDNC